MFIQDNCLSRQSICSSSCTVSLRSCTTASTSALVVPLPTLSLKALAATSEGTPQLRRTWEGLVDRHNAVQESYATAINVSSGEKSITGKRGASFTCFHRLSGKRHRHWPAALYSWTIPSSLKQERQRLIIQSFCCSQIALCRSWTASDKHSCRVRRHCVALAGQNWHGIE